MKNKMIGRRLVLAVLGTLLAGGTMSVPAQAAGLDRPLTVKTKDCAVNGDAEVTLQPESNPFHVIQISKAASGGTVRINSGKITAHVKNAGGPQFRIDGIISNEGSQNKEYWSSKNTIGYEGNVDLADGLTLTVDGTGTCPKIAGIYENGFQNLSGDQTIRGLNTGKPADLIYNLGNHTTIQLTGNDQVESAPDGLEQFVYYSQSGIVNDGGIMHVGDDLTVSSDVQGKYTLNAMGISNVKYGQIRIGDNAEIKASGSLSELSSGYGAELYGILSRQKHAWDDGFKNKGRQSVTLGKNARVEVDFNSPGTKNESPASIMGVAVLMESTDFTAGENLHLSTIQEDSGIGTYGLFAWNQSKADIGDGFQVDVTAKGHGFGVYGVYAGHYTNQGTSVDGTHIAFQGHVQENLQAADSYHVFGNYFNASSLQLQGEDDIGITANGAFNHIVGTYLLHPGAELQGAESSLRVVMDVKGDSRTDPYDYEKTEQSHVDALAVENGASAALKNVSVDLGVHGSLIDATQIAGISYRPGKAAASAAEEDGDTPHVSVSGKTELAVIAENTGIAGNQEVYGIYNRGGRMGLADVRIQAKGENMGVLSGVRTTENGTTHITGSGEIVVSGDANDQTGISSTQGGQAVFDHGIAVSGAKTAIESKNEGSFVDITGDGTKNIEGNLLSEDGGILRLSLHDGTSVLTGLSTVKNAETDLTVSRGALWNMTGDSQVTHLELGQGGRIDMKASSAYATLQADTFAGQDGILYMKTDLASEKDGDKLRIGSAEAGSRASIQVQDASLTSGKEVTGVKNLLLVTDASKNAVFTGKSLDKGGLWDVTPTIQRGDTVKDAQGHIVGKPEEWYLTKVEKQVNKDTRPLIAVTDSQYGLYRDSLDTLRQRMGDLRFLKKKEDAAGLWARMRDGEFSGPDSLDTRHHNFQLGFDEVVNPKSVYGVLAERSIASSSYAYGKGKDHSLAGALYGTWFGDDGSYTDVVARYNRDDAHVSTCGGYPDRADWRSHDISASVEYGRTIPVNDNGYFVEPQAQFQLGHLGGYDYTTLRGKTVQADGTNSAIGRIGFVAGRRGKDASHPFDWYVKASVLHEFAGDRDLHLTADDGETMDIRKDNQGTWCTFGLGGSIRTGHGTYLYGDLERSFGGDLQKKWQVNVGVQYQF